MIRKGSKYFKVSNNNDSIEVYKVQKMDDGIFVFFTKGFKKDVKFYKRKSMAIKFIKVSFYTSEDIKAKLIEEIEKAFSVVS